MMIEVIRDALDAWSANPPHQYRQGGQWIQDGPQLPAYTQGGPGTGAATVWRATGEDRHRQMALQSIGWMLTTYQTNGGTETGKIVDGVTTMFFGQELGHTYLLLEDAPHFQDEQAAWWRLALTKAADYLINAGHTVWYANGNINCGYALVLYLAARITGLQRFRDEYERALWFVQFPPHPWEALGLQVSTRPAMRDGSDGAAFFTETGAGGTGLDVEYTGVQLDVLARLYVLSGDERVLRLVNVLANQVLSRVDRATWLLDTSGGTRHPQQGRTVPFCSPAPAILEAAGRTDFAGLGAQQWPSIEATYRAAFTQSNPNFYRGLGCQLAVIALDQLTRSGAIARIA